MALLLFLPLYAIAQTTPGISFIGIFISPSALGHLLTYQAKALF